MTGGSNAAAWWSARVAALALVAVAASLLWRNTIGLQHGDDRPIWIEPGEYKGPPDAALDPAQVEAVNARAQRLNY
jgi:hypothetical protein